MPFLNILPEKIALVLTGTDTVSFLNSLLTTDIKKLLPQTAQVAGLLSPQGKFLHELMLYRHNDSVWMIADSARVDDLIKRLTLYKLRSAVKIEKQPALQVVFSDSLLSTELSWTDPRLPNLGYWSLLPTDTTVPLPTDNTLWHKTRLQIGIADASHDMVVDRTVVLEFGYADLGCVDFTKGCYVGQELMARTHHRGLVRKRALPVRIEGTPPTVDTLILYNGQEVGKMRSSYQTHGLALCKMDLVLPAIDTGQPLHAGDSQLWPTIPPWMQIDRSTLAQLTTTEE